MQTYDDIRAVITEKDYSRIITENIIEFDYRKGD